MIPLKDGNQARISAKGRYEKILSYTANTINAIRLDGEETAR